MGAHVLNVILLLLSKINFDVQERDSIYHTFMIKCPSGYTVLFCDVAVMTWPESHGTEICLSPQPGFGQNCWFL